MAAQLSPIEAVKFSEYGYFYKKSGTSKYSAIKMAWRNIIRIPQRAVKVFGSLFFRNDSIFGCFSNTWKCEYRVVYGAGCISGG